MEFKQRKILLSNNRMAVIMVNYNMDHVIRQNINYLHRAVKYPFDIFIVDQSSDDKWRFKAKENENIIQANLNYNFRAPLAYNMCLKLADSYAEWNQTPEYKYYLVCATSGLMDPEGNKEEDIYTPCIEFLEENEDAVMIQPAYQAESQAMNAHIFNTGSVKPRKVMHFEYLLSVFRGDWLREQNGWNTAMLIHGQDLWFSYLARMEGKTMWVHEGFEIKKEEHNSYNSGRMSDNPGSRSANAMETLIPFGQTMLGPDWWNRIWTDYAEPGWRNPQVLI